MHLNHHLTPYFYSADDRLGRPVPTLAAQTSPAPQSPGTVYLVGAGPGDPGLITVRGLELLRRAGAVLYDALSNPALLDEAPVHAERIYVGKRAGRHAKTQEQIHELLRAKAQEYAVVVRLKAGDPYVFGRGSEERAWLLTAGVPVEVVPGVSSAIAAAEAADVPLTHRGLSSCFAVVTGRYSSNAPQPPDWDALARVDTLVVMMGLELAGEIAQRLLAAGRDLTTPVAIVAAATLPNQQVIATTLAGLEAAAATLSGDLPATIIVGAVAALATATAQPVASAQAPSSS